MLPAVPEVRAVRVNTDRAAAGRQRQTMTPRSVGSGAGVGPVGVGKYGRRKPRLHAFCRGRGECTGHLLAIESQHVSAAGRQNDAPGRRQHPDSGKRHSGTAAQQRTAATLISWS